jgi:hydroxyacylglutathione hydrolase
MDKMLTIVTCPVGQMQANCYILADNETHEALIIDPGDDGEYIIGKITERQLTPIAILATHGHFDHLMGALEVKLAFGIPFFIHKQDEFLLKQMQSSAEHFLGIRPDPPANPDGYLEETQTIQLGQHNLSIIHTPGHTPGSVCFFNPTQHMLITGDLIFANGGVGRTDFSYSKPLELLESIHKVFLLPPETVIYPGHGGPSTLEEERIRHKAKYN